MKKTIFFKIFLLVPFLIFSQTRYDPFTMAAMYGNEYELPPQYEKIELPELLEGIWQGSDRYIFFNETQADRLKSNIAVLLKTYYGWFYDRSAEPEEYANVQSRYVCTATYPVSEKVFVSYENLQKRLPRYDENGNLILDDSGAYELIIRFGEKEKEEIRIPIAIIGNDLYLDFVLRTNLESLEVNDNQNENDNQNQIQNDSQENLKDASKLLGVWHGVSRKKAIRISPLPLDVNLYSYYITQDATYKIRYWPTTMAYTDANANFTDDEKTYHIAKHIVSDNVIFTCVTGRSSRIRNVEKTHTHFSDYTLDSTGTICAFGKPYLTKVLGEQNANSLIAIVEEANSRRKSDPAPLFPAKDLDWHWDLIALLEKDNEYIQDFRKNVSIKAQKKMKQPWYSSRLKLESSIAED